MIRKRMEEDEDKLRDSGSSSTAAAVMASSPPSAIAGFVEERIRGQRYYSNPVNSDPHSGNGGDGGGGGYFSALPDSDSPSPW